MQRFAVVLFALVALFAIVVPSASAHSPMKRETNADRFARGLPPLAPSRRETAKRQQNSQASVPRSGRIQVRDDRNGNSYGYVQNGPTGPGGVNPGNDLAYTNLFVVYDTIQKSVLCLDSQFSGIGLYFGAAVIADILGADSIVYVVLTNVEIGIETAEAGIWNYNEVTGELTAVWENIDGSTVVVSCAYNVVENTLVLVGNRDGFVGQYPDYVPVKLILV